MNAQSLSPSFAAKLDKHLDKQSRRWQPQVAVRAPRLGIDYRYGDADLPFHSASVGKLVTATLVMQLVEQQIVSPDTRVLPLLGAETLRGIFANGHEHEVSIGQLLTHTSGVNDYFDGRTDGQTVLAAAISDPDQSWTPQSLLAYARDKQKPVAAPGRKFFYSDTGYIVLGLLLEQLTGMTFERLVHERIFAPLGMTRSFLPQRTRPALGSDTIAPFYLGKKRFDGTPALTLDWAGGGLAGTADDHLTLIRALHTGQLISPQSWAWMTEPRHRFRMGLHYGAGAMSVRFSGLVPWLWRWPRPVGHLGLTAAHLWHDPVHDAEIVINFGSPQAMNPSFFTLIEIVGQLRRLA